MNVRVIFVTDSEGCRWAFLMYVLPELEPGIYFEFEPDDHAVDSPEPSWAN